MVSPFATVTRRTIPLASALISCSIFIDSMIKTVWPARTVSPTATAILTMVPWSGEATTSEPSAGVSSVAAALVTPRPSDCPYESTARGSFVSILAPASPDFASWVGGVEAACSAMPARTSAAWSSM